MKTTKSILLIATAIAGLSAGVSAQTLSATWKSTTTMTAYTYFRSGTTKQAAANTDLSKGLALAATNSASARTGCGLYQTASAFQATISEYGTARYFSSSTRSYASTGNHSTLLTLKSTKTMKATLRMTWTITRRDGGFASCSVDIANNGSLDFAASSTAVTKDFPVTISSSGLAIKTTTGGRASPSSFYKGPYYSASLRIQVLPRQTCLFYEYGTTCGPKLTGTNGFGDTVIISATGATKNGTGVIIAGQTRIDLPFGSCRLLTQPYIILPVKFDANGNVSLTIPLPPTRPVAIPAQLGVFGGKPSTSNGLVVICP